MTRPWRGFGVASDSTRSISTWHQLTCESSYLRAVRGSSTTNSDSGTRVNICRGSRVGVHGKIQSCSSHKSFLFNLQGDFFLALWTFNRANYHCKNSIYLLVKNSWGTKEETGSQFEFFEFWIHEMSCTCMCQPSRWLHESRLLHS